MEVTNFSHLLCQWSVASVGAIHNLVLVLLIIFKSPKQLGYYKCLMIYISVFEILYSILDFLSVAVRTKIEKQLQEALITGNLQQRFSFCYSNLQTFGYASRVFIKTCEQTVCFFQFGEHLDPTHFESFLSWFVNFQWLFVVFLACRWQFSLFTSSIDILL